MRPKSWGTTDHARVRRSTRPHQQRLANLAEQFGHDPRPPIDLITWEKNVANARIPWENYLGPGVLDV
jgi:hypothetical protein